MSPKFLGRTVSAVVALAAATAPLAGAAAQGYQGYDAPPPPPSYGQGYDAPSSNYQSAAPERGYLAIQAYLDRGRDASADDLRPALAHRSGLQTTFGWGPRFLHSTGQYHKGGHPNGVFLQITGAVSEDLAVPDRPYTFASLQAAQAAGDAAVLAGQGRPVLHVHLTDRAAGLGRLLDAL